MGMALKRDDQEIRENQFTSEEDKDFEKLLEGAYEKEKKFRTGEVVPGRVIKVNPDTVLVDISYKSEGLVDIGEFDRDDDGKRQVASGDELLVFIETINEDEDGYLYLSKEKADRYKVWDEIAEVYESDAVIEGKCVEKVRGGLVVDIGVKAFLPASQIALIPPRDLDGFMGETVKCKIVKFNKRRGNIVLSRRAVLEHERDSKRAEILSNLTEGDVVEGIIKNVTDYGVFVDLGGLDGLLHVTDISWGRAENPQKMFRVGEPLQVKILKYDREKERVSLGLKQLKENPWDDAITKYPSGSVISGKVISITNYGAFVSLEDGVEGLIHVSEMSWSKKVKHPNKLLEAGQEVKAKVLEVDSENKKISLGIKQLEANPWEALVYKYPIGSTVKGTISNVADFGVFVTVEDGIDGLVHVSDLSWSGKVKNPSETFQKGTEIEVKVLHIDVESEKFSLGLKQLKRDPWETVDKKYPVGTRATGKVVRITDFGAFVALEPEIEGLIHISEMSEQKVEDIGALLSEGQDIEVEVTNVDKGERKISLSMRALHRREQGKEMKKYLDSGDSLSSSLGDAFKKTS